MMGGTHILTHRNRVSKISRQQIDEYGVALTPILDEQAMALASWQAKTEGEMSAGSK